MRRILIQIALIAAPLLAAHSALAQTIPYALDKARSTVVFTFDMAGSPTKGEMQVSAADIRLNLGNIEQSSARVTIDAASAKTRPSFANDAMHGANVLHTTAFPTMTFETTAFDGDFNGGTVQGLLTLRGVTKPVSMKAQIFRQRGSSDNDISRLSVLLTGTVDRRAFGADGFPQIVGPNITFEVLTRIDRQ